MMFALVNNKTVIDILDSKNLINHIKKFIEPNAITNQKLTLNELEMNPAHGDGEYLLEMDNNTNVILVEKKTTYDNINNDIKVNIIEKNNWSLYEWLVPNKLLKTCHSLDNAGNKCGRLIRYDQFVCNLCEAELYLREPKKCGKIYN